MSKHHSSMLKRCGFAVNKGGTSVKLSGNLNRLNFNRLNRNHLKLALGRILTYVLSAPVVAIAVIGLVACTHLPLDGVNLRWVAVAVVFLGVFPLAGYLVPAFLGRRAGTGREAGKGRDKETGRETGKETRDRLQRLVSFAVNLVSYPAGAILLYLGRAPAVLTAIAASYTATVVLLALVNLFYKASGHASGVAGPIVAFFILYGSRALPSLVLLPLVAWARVQVKGHTWPQTVAGALIAAGATWGAFAVFLH